MYTVVYYYNINMYIIIIYDFILMSARASTEEYNDNTILLCILNVLAKSCRVFILYSSPVF